MLADPHVLPAPARLSRPARSLFAEASRVPKHLKASAMVLAVAIVAALFPKVAWAAAPVVGSVALTSQPGPDRTYGEEGDTVLATVTFDQVVYVTGSPSISLKLGAAVKAAGYQSGSGSTRLVFGYTVGPGDLATVGVALEAGAIALNGGTLQNQGGEAALLDHPALAPDVAHRVDRRCVQDAGLVSLSGTFDIATSEDCLIPVSSRPDPPGLELHWRVPASAEHAVVFVSGDSAHPGLDTTTVGVENGTRHGVDDGIVCNALGECGGNDDYHAPFRFGSADVDDTGSHVYAAYQYGRKPGAFGTATLHVTLVPWVTGVTVAVNSCVASTSLTWDEPPDLGRAVSWIVLLTQDAASYPKRRGRPDVHHATGPTVSLAGLAADQTYFAKVLSQVEVLGAGGYLETGRVDNADQVSFTAPSPPAFLVPLDDLVLRAETPLAEGGLALPSTSGDCGPYAHALCRTQDAADGTCANVVLPAGLAFDAATGSLTGTPAAVASGVQYLYTVRNSHGHAVSGEFSLAIAGPGGEDDTVPAVSSLRFASQPADDSQAYADSEVVSLEVAFDQPVFVSRRPTVALTVGSDERQLAYAGGSGTDTLTFTYTVASCDVDADGVSVAANAFDLAGGLVVSAADRTVLASLSHESLDGGTGQQVAAACPGQ